MAEFSYPNSAHSGGDLSELEYERWATSYPASGLVGTATDLPLVYADSSGLNVKFRADRYAHLLGITWGSGTTDLVKAVAPNATGAVRNDLVVLRLQRPAYVITGEVRTGASGGALPVLTQSMATNGAYEIPVAAVAVPNGAATIAASAVTNRGWYLGPQTIVCTASTRPPPLAGQRIYDIDAGKEFTGNGVAFIAGYSDRDTGWSVSPPAAAGWTGLQTYLRRVNGITYCMMTYQRSGGTVAKHAQSKVAQLPAGYAPAYGMSLLAYASGGWLIHGHVDSAGGVYMDNHYNDFLNGHNINFGVTTWPAG